MKSKLKTLLKLLEDEDIEISSKAMSEILQSDKVVWKIIGRLHENGDPSIRRKAHQLQFAARSRARRKKLSLKMQEKNIDLLNALIELHLQWFDEDSEEYIRNQWEKFKNISSNWDANSIEGLAQIMTKFDFHCTDFNELEAADYCIGEVLSSKNGSDFMLCIICRLLAREHGWYPSVVATDAGFCTYDEKNKLGLFPAKNWALAKCKIKDNIRRWTDSMLLNLTATSMFFCATSGGHLRYTYMLGTCIAGSLGTSELPELLPYPLGKVKN